MKILADLYVTCRHFEMERRKDSRGIDTRNRTGNLGKKSFLVKSGKFTHRTYPDNKEFKLLRNHINRKKTQTREIFKN